MKVIKFLPLLLVVSCASALKVLEPPKPLSAGELADLRINQCFLNYSSGENLQKIKLKYRVSGDNTGKVWGAKLIESKSENLELNNCVSEALFAKPFPRSTAKENGFSVIHEVVYKDENK